MWVAVLVTLLLQPASGYLYPQYSNPWRQFAVRNDSTLRDPTTVVFDNKTSTWHIYCTRVLLKYGPPGYWGSIWHFSTNATKFDDPAAVWTDEGEVIPPSGNGNFDNSGTFTPGIVVECTSSNDCTWYLFYGGVANEQPARAENVGLAISNNPWGPFKRRQEPVFNRTDSSSGWCGTTAARVDEIKSSVISGQKYIFVKSVCSNDSALPVAYIPENGWGPPYKQIPPIFSAADTCKSLGFEEPTIFIADDNLLHFTGHYHGNCGSAAKYAHFINPTRTLHGWVKVADFGSSNNSSFFEPVPVPLSFDGVYGGEISRTWVDFGAGRGGSPTWHLMMSQPVWVNVTN